VHRRRVLTLWFTGLLPQSGRPSRTDTNRDPSYLLTPRCGERNVTASGIHKAGDISCGILATFSWSARMERRRSALPWDVAIGSGLSVAAHREPCGA
jgi:hypothetical protein